MHDKIFIHGFVDNLKMREIINNCDVCVLPSLEDGFGMTPLQAMSCGCPVIISENTGSAESVPGSQAEHFDGPPPAGFLAAGGTTHFAADRFGFGGVVQAGRAKSARTEGGHGTN